MTTIDGRRQKRRADRRHRTQSDAKMHRCVAYRRTSTGTYRVHVSDAGRGTWATFLTQMTARPGWSVARLAREAQIHRSTIFRWMKGDGGLTLQSVRSIADALDVDLEVALLAAGNLINRPKPGEPDEERDMIMASDATPAQKARMLQRLEEFRQEDERRIQELRETNKQRRMETIKLLLDQDA